MLTHFILIYFDLLRMVHMNAWHGAAGKIMLHLILERASVENHSSSEMIQTYDANLYFKSWSA